MALILLAEVQIWSGSVFILFQINLLLDTKNTLLIVIRKYHFVCVSTRAKLLIIKLKRVRLTVYLPNCTCSLMIRERLLKWVRLLFSVPPSDSNPHIRYLFLISSISYSKKKDIH